MNGYYRILQVYVYYFILTSTGLTSNEIQTHKLTYAIDVTEIKYCRLPYTTVGEKSSVH